VPFSLSALQRSQNDQECKAGCGWAVLAHLILRYLLFLVAGPLSRLQPYVAALGEFSDSRNSLKE